MKVAMHRWQILVGSYQRHMDDNAGDNNGAALLGLALLGILCWCALGVAGV